MNVLTRRRLLAGGSAAILAGPTAAEELDCGSDGFTVRGFFSQPDTCQQYSPEIQALLALADGEPEPTTEELAMDWATLPDPVPAPQPAPVPVATPAPKTQVIATATAPQSSQRPAARPGNIAQIVRIARANLTQSRQTAAAPKQPPRVAAVTPAPKPRVAAPAVRVVPAKGTREFYSTSRRHGTERITYFADGRYINQAAIRRQVCDWRNGAEHEIDPRVLDFQWRLRMQLGITEPWFIISGYRSPQTNALLRAKSNGGVAKSSLHMRGMALDLRLRSRSPVQIFKAAWGLGAGGTSPYSDSDFAHIDCGGRRTWGEGLRYV